MPFAAARRPALYLELIDQVRPLPGARALLEGLHRLGYRVVLASSAKRPEVDHYVDLLEARRLVDAATSGDDVERTKPEPDLVSVAMERLAETECPPDDRRHHLGRDCGRPRRGADDRPPVRRVR